MAMKPVSPVMPVKPVKPPKLPNPVANPPHAPLTKLPSPVANPPHGPLSTYGSEDHPVVHRTAAENSPYQV